MQVVDGQGSSTDCGIASDGRREGRSTVSFIPLSADLESALTSSHTHECRCSGDLLLEALVACTGGTFPLARHRPIKAVRVGKKKVTEANDVFADAFPVTLRAVATSLEIPLTDGEITVEGDLDFRGTLGVDKTAPVGFTAIRLTFKLDCGDTPIEKVHI